MQQLALNSCVGSGSRCKTAPLKTPSKRGLTCQQVLRPPHPKEQLIDPHLPKVRQPQSFVPVLVSDFYFSESRYVNGGCFFCRSPHAIVDRKKQRRMQVAWLSICLTRAYSILRDIPVRCSIFPAFDTRRGSKI